MLSKRLLYLLKYSLFWLFFFFVSRILFISYNAASASHIKFGHLLLSFIHGFRLDLSMTGYLLLVSCIILALTFSSNRIWINRIMNVFTGIILGLFSLITITDIELYRNWGFRMDSTIINYIKTPKEALASTKPWLTLILFLATVLLTTLFYKIYKKYVANSINTISGRSWLTIPVFILLAGFMILPIRGGLGIAPINTGVVFYSPHSFANHAAINVQWQLGYSLDNMGKEVQKRILDQSTTETVFKQLMSDQERNIQYTNVKKPNIILLVLESFTARVIEPLGGVKGATPNINSLIKQGVLFDNCFANGDRSAKGLVAILSGYPAQSKTSIMNNSNKSAKLPSIIEDFEQIGYNTSYYYGGDINFANMKSYLYTCKFNNIISLHDFDKKDLNSKWGAHDHVVFNRLYKDCNKSKEPFFNVFFTLSSHEPFEVPMKSKFSGNSEEQEFLNSIHYTDSCIGSFIANAKTQDWWDNTLILLVADHGSRWPGNISFSSREKFEIPMILLGGALNTSDTIISNYCNQVDIAKLLTDQVGLKNDKYIFSKSINDSTYSFGFYAFNNGYGYFTDSSGYIYNNTSQKIMNADSNITSKIMNEGKAYMQTIFDDYLEK